MAEGNFTSSRDIQTYVYLSRQSQPNLPTGICLQSKSVFHSFLLLDPCKTLPNLDPEPLTCSLLQLQKQLTSFILSSSICPANIFTVDVSYVLVLKGVSQKSFSSFHPIDDYIRKFVLLMVFYKRRKGLSVTSE